MHERKITPEKLQEEEMFNRWNRKKLGMMPVYPKKASIKTKSLAEEMNDLSNTKKLLELNTFYNSILRKIRSASATGAKSIEITPVDFGCYKTEIEKLLKQEKFKVENKLTQTYRSAHDVTQPIIIISWDL